MSKFTAAIMLCAGLTLPLAAAPQHDRDDERREEHHERNRYYDQDRKDYHEWNEAESRAWRRYWEMERRPYTDWQAAKAEQRAAYWRWRHNHPDSVLWPDRH
jgi:hypothetical protein